MRCHTAVGTPAYYIAGFDNLPADIDDSRQVSWLEEHRGNLCDAYHVCDSGMVTSSIILASSHTYGQQSMAHTIQNPLF
jgi:hypothetical protein